MKPITFSEKMMDQTRDEGIAEMLKQLDEKSLIKEFLTALAKARMSDGKFSFKKEFKYEKNFVYTQDTKRRVLIRITPDAYAKMLTIIMSNSEEVGWHGVTERVSDTEFLVKDIFVYPQKVTATTVDTDDAEYAKWLIDLDKIDESIFLNLHFHGHSHVNMGVFASTTDMWHREKIVSQLGDEDYYIFMIWNKKLEWSAAVYDVASNVLYETADIDVMVEFADGSTAGDVLDDVKKKVAPYSYSAPKANNLPAKKNENPPAWWEQEKKRNGGSGAGNGSQKFPGDEDFGYYPGAGGYCGYYDY